MTSLPPDATGPLRVQHVADGDTFVLKVKNRRVRVLGVDTPELKSGAPFSKEAKAFTQKLIDGKDVWLVYGSEKTDRFGRELAIVFFADDRVGKHGSYACLNSELIYEGLAYYYSPTPIPFEAQFIAAQKEARMAHRSIWQDFRDFDAVVTARGRCFHSRQCEFASKARVTPIKASVGFDKGLSMCRNCLNDDGIDHQQANENKPHEQLGVISQPPKENPWGKEHLKPATQRIAGQRKNLPNNVKKVVVQQVIDGDTLQLAPDAEGSKRVQLLGVNAPEADARSRDAAIATSFLTQLIPNESTVYLQFDRSGDEDAEGNWIAMVYAKDVTDGEGYICVNIALIGEGLAVFEDRTSGQLINEAQIVKVQQEARDEGKGLWNERTNTFFQTSKHESTKVYTEGKYRFYHSTPVCQRVWNQREVADELLFSALDDGLQPCHACNAPFLFYEDGKAQENEFTSYQQFNKQYNQHNQYNAAASVPAQSNQQPQHEPPRPVPSQAPQPKKDAFSKCCSVQ